MADGKVLHEVRIIETDDGYRIEIKGDKERLKEMFKHGGPLGMAGRFGHGFGPWGQGRHGHHGPFGWGHRGPWSGWYEDEERDRSEKEPRNA